jgi:hypothetical protein
VVHALIVGQNINTMKVDQYPIILWAIAIICVTTPMRAEEILFHSGPPVSTPELKMVTPFPEKGSPKMIEFQREFFIDRDLLASLPARSSEYGSIPISAIDAINLARKHVDPNDGLRSFIVTEVRLMKGPAKGERQVEYYFVSMVANGSEEHRVVLMNGTLLASKLRKIEEKAQQAAPSNR